jgi:hypothetical protein
MRITILFCLLVLVLSTTSCLTKPSPSPMSERVPKDLAIADSRGEGHPERGRTDIEINARGEGLYQSRSGIMFKHVEFRKTFILNETELLDLVDELEKSGFYPLHDSYHNPSVIDGSCDYISITKNNVTKFVSVSNIAAPEAYEKAAMLIEGTAENKMQT